MLSGVETNTAMFCAVISVCVAAYLIFVASLKKNAIKTTVAVAVISGLVFAMIAYVLLWFCSVTGIVFMYIITVLVIIALCYYLIRKQTDEEVENGKSLYILFVLYLFSISTITIFSRDGDNNLVNVNVLRILEDPFTMRHFALNAVMFMPAGFLYAFSGKKHFNFLFYFAFGMLCSIIIENIQFIFHYGDFDINDIIGNALGMALGGMISWIIINFSRRRKNE